jgi:hypothetical protein
MQLLKNSKNAQYKVDKSVIQKTTKHVPTHGLMGEGGNG